MNQTWPLSCEQAVDLSSISVSGCLFDRNGSVLALGGHGKGVWAWAGVHARLFALVHGFYFQPPIFLPAARPLPLVNFCQFCLWSKYAGIYCLTILSGLISNCPQKQPDAKSIRNVLRLLWRYSFNMQCSTNNKHLFVIVRCEFLLLHMWILISYLPSLGAKNTTLDIDHKSMQRCHCSKLFSIVNFCSFSHSLYICQ